MRAGLDKLDNSGWGVMLRLDYMAWLPPSKTEAKGVVAALGHRSGIAKVGHTHKHKKHKGDARAVQVHVPFEPPLLPPAGAPQGRSFTAAPQVVATVAGEPVRPTLGFGCVVFFQRSTSVVSENCRSLWSTAWRWGAGAVVSGRAHGGRARDRCARL